MTDYEFVEEVSRYTNDKYGFTIEMQEADDFDKKIRGATHRFYTKIEGSGYASVIHNRKDFKEQVYDFANWIFDELRRKGKL